MAQELPTVTVELDRPRRLRIDPVALGVAEALLRRAERGGEISLEDYAAFVHGCLVPEDRD